MHFNENGSRDFAINKNGAQCIAVSHPKYKKGQSVIQNLKTEDMISRRMRLFTRFVSMLFLMFLGYQCAVTDEKDWIDPYDMENFDPSSNSMKNNDHGSEKSASSSKEKVDDPVKEETITSSEPGQAPEKAEAGSCSKGSSPCVSPFRQYVKSLLYHIRGKVYSGVEDLNLRVKITATDVEYLEKYTDPSGSEKDFHHVHEILASMVQLASEVQDGDPSVQRLWLETIIGMPVEKFLMFAVLAGILILTFVAATKFHFSWWKLTVKLIFFLFVISVFWQWYELYKKEAKPHLAIMKEMPEGCRKREKDENMVSTFLRSLTSTFTFEKDECLQYYDPFWQALAKTFVRFFLSPMRDIGEAIREFFTGLLKDLPAQLWPVVLASVGIFSFLLLFMYFGYRVSLPFGLIAIEPGSRADNTQVQRAIAQLNAELKALKDAQEGQAKQLMDVLHEALQKQSDNQEKILSLPSVQSSLMKALQSGDQKPVALKDQSPSYEDVSLCNVTKGYCSSLRDDTHETLNGVQAVRQEDKGTVKQSDSESFEEISVLNIEADTTGQGDN